jgi:hypothetical protein
VIVSGIEPELIPTLAFMTSLFPDGHIAGDCHIQIPCRYGIEPSMA